MGDNEYVGTINLVRRHSSAVEFLNASIRVPGSNPTISDSQQQKTAEESRRQQKTVVQEDISSSSNRSGLEE